MAPQAVSYTDFKIFLMLTWQHALIHFQAKKSNETAHLVSPPVHMFIFLLRNFTFLENVYVNEHFRKYNIKNYTIVQIIQKLVTH